MINASARAMMRSFTTELAGMGYHAYASNPGSVRMGRQIDDRFVEVRIQADGDCRATHFIDDTASAPPVHFRTIARMKRALAQKASRR